MAAGLVTTVLAGLLSLSAVQPASAAKVHKKEGLQPGTFRVASFNVLGASHTRNGARGRAEGVVRIGWANRLLNAHHVDVAGFQEMQKEQLDEFLLMTDGRWAVYPGLQLKQRDSENSIGWRTDKFTLVNATTVNIPYFDGNPRAMPIVLLRDKASGMLTYFTNFHNPADTHKHHHQQKWRVEASNIEIALQNQLMWTGIPRVMTGDMNERGDYFCRVTAKTPLKAARPGTYRRDGECHPDKPRAVDWILGSKKAVFTKYLEDRSPFVHKTSDHPMIAATMTVDPDAMPQAWQTTDPAPITPKKSWHR